jgi:ABC-type multidrug transport system ATPase subunit
MGVIARDLVVRRGAFVLDVSALEADGSGLAVLGPNGAGKTTLLLALHGLIAANGTVQRPLRSASVFAVPAVLRGSAVWNVAVVCEAVLGVTRAEARRRASTALQDVGVDDTMHRDARSLSTGQRQRLALARALAVEPQALFLDEPLANVDADARPGLRALVRRYVERTGCDLVLATSSFADSAALCRNAVVLRGGEVVHAGAVASLAASDDPYARGLVAEARADLTRGGR